MNLLPLAGDMRRVHEDVNYSAALCVAAERRLSTFVRAAWALHHEEEPLDWSWHIDCICEHLEAAFAGEIHFLLINVPPGFAKSLLTSVYFPAWMWLRKPWYQILCSSTNEALTLRDARRHKDLVASPWYQSVFAPTWQLSRTHAADTNFATSRGGWRLSRTVESSISGQRPHIRILDDANDIHKTNSDTCAALNHWLEGTLLKRRKSIYSPFVAVQQRLFEIDVTGYMLAREQNPNLTQVHLVLPNRYEKKRAFSSPVLERATGKPWTDHRTTEDELLHELILDRAQTTQEQANDPAMDAAQNQQNPTPKAGVIFQRDMFRRWSHEPTIDDWPKDKEIDFDAGDFPTYPLPKKFDFLIITADLNNLKSEKATRGTDYAVLDVWGRLSNDRYLVAQIRQRLGVAATMAAIVQLIKLHSSSLACVLIESKANGPTVIGGVRALMGIAAEEKLPQTHQFIRPWDVQGETKRQRAEGIAYVPAGGRVYIPSELEQAYFVHWLDEICGYPNRTRDDCVDTLVMALTFLERDRQFG